MYYLLILNLFMYSNIIWIVIYYRTTPIIYTYNNHKNKTTESMSLLKTDTCCKFHHVSFVFLYFFYYAYQN